VGPRFPRLYKTVANVQGWLESKQLVAAKPIVPPAVGEVLDYTVDERVRRDPQYRPPNLKVFFDPNIWSS